MPFAMPLSTEMLSALGYQSMQSASSFPSGDLMLQEPQEFRWFILAVLMERSDQRGELRVG
jgi:hypothetical protein